MVNQKSKLFQNKPEWVMRNPAHELASQREQFGLDVANPAVQEFLFASHDIVEALGEPVFVK